MSRSVSAILTSAVLLSQPAVASAATPLEPTGTWSVNNGETLCIASRSYGSSADPLSLSIVPSANGQSYEILVGSKYKASEPATEEQGAVDFGSGPIAAWALFYQTANRTSDVHDFRVSAAEMDRAKTASAMTLHIQSSSDFTFELDSMPEVLGELKSCTANLERHWNIGGEMIGLFSRPPRADLRDAFSPEDYPFDALRRGQTGKGQYLLLVDEDGKVAGCQVLLATGVPVLDVMACLVIQSKARFTPALDRTGKPVRSTYVTPPISWQLGG
jgi:TonB family protein